MDMAKDESDAIIVRSTIALAHNMGLKVTAEGGEIQDILDLLNSLECDIAQGHHIARSVPVEQPIEWLKSNIFV